MITDTIYTIYLKILIVIGLEAISVVIGLEAISGWIIRLCIMDGIILIEYVILVKCISTILYYRSPSVEEEINNSKVNLKNYMR